MQATQSFMGREEGEEEGLYREHALIPQEEEEEEEEECPKHQKNNNEDRG